MPPRPKYSHVPNVHQVIPGAAVHIVLKQDQPTGRTVQGTIQTVLTRGNHPRGIKVRLSDGRVGRVQSMDTGSTAASGANQAGISANSATSVFRSTGVTATSDDDAPRESIGLDAYIRPGKPKQQRRRRNGPSGEASDDISTEQTSQLPTPASVVICPVCEEFEGDEAAVSHHVATHFEAAN